MILSASGWRGIFAENGDEESTTDKISEAHRIISGAGAYIFACYLKRRLLRTETPEGTAKKPLVLLGTDTRPTGKAIAAAMIPVLSACGCDVHYAGVTAAPEIMAWARQYDSKNSCGFIYISASHNPVGHNGFKFGLTDGGVLNTEEANNLIADFHLFMESDDNILKIKSLIGEIGDFYAYDEKLKSEAIKAYNDFCGEVVWGSSPDIAAVLKNSFGKQPLGIVCDFNGSARTVSIDSEFFSSLGFQFESINCKPGQIAHRIVPEGESLDPCCKLLDEAHSRNSLFLMGYVPDCDGDRGNLVIWDDAAGKSRALEAQEVFAIACIAELSHLVWTETANKAAGKVAGRAAVAINDPTSMRIDRIAEAFGVSVFRAEVGEANVVSLARRLREEGYIVRILGEGSAGGNITHPSAVRDPINTVMAIAKLFSVRSSKNNDTDRGYFKIWCELSGQEEKYRDNFTLADIIASLPPFISTPAYNKDASFRIKTCDHAALKERYQKIFLREWEERKNELKTRFGFYKWDAAIYNGITERRGINRFNEAGKGGLKIIFIDNENREKAFIWMRGSATEPVFRIMADVQGRENQAERYLLEWQHCMIIEADNN